MINRTTTNINTTDRSGPSSTRIDTDLQLTLHHSMMIGPFDRIVFEEFEKRMLITFSEDENENKNEIWFTIFFPMGVFQKFDEFFRLC